MAQKHKFSKKYIKSTVREIENKHERGDELEAQGAELKAHAANLLKMLRDSGVTEEEIKDARTSLAEADANREKTSDKKKAA